MVTPGRTVAIDQHGELIDGHNRQRIAKELNIPCPVHPIVLPDDPDERAQALGDLNFARRQKMDTHQRKEVVAHLRRQGHSLRAIGGAIGVDHKTISRDLEGIGEDSPMPTHRRPMYERARTGPVGWRRITPGGVRRCGPQDNQEMTSAWSVLPGRGATP